MLFSVFFHGTIFFATIFAFPFVAKKPLELMPIVSVELIQISEKTNIPYAPKAAKIIEKAKKDNKKLWFINLGGYNSKSMQEKHEFGLVVASTASDAKKLAKSKWLHGFLKKQIDLSLWWPLSEENI